MRLLQGFALVAMTVSLPAASMAQGPQGEAFSKTKLTQAQLVAATRAAEGSAVRTRYLKATCAQQLEAFNRFTPDVRFTSCEQLANLYEIAEVRDCPAFMNLAYLKDGRVIAGTGRAREVGEQCLYWKEKELWLVSLWCANCFTQQPPRPQLQLAPTPKPEIPDSSVVAVGVTATVSGSVEHIHRFPDPLRVVHEGKLNVEEEDDGPGWLSRSWKPILGTAAVGAVAWGIICSRPQNRNDRACPGWHTRDDSEINIGITVINQSIGVMYRIPIRR